MKERLLEELQKGSKGAVMKKHIITYLIYNENSTITDLAKDMDLSRDSRKLVQTNLTI